MELSPTKLQFDSYTLSLFFWANLCLLELDHPERWLIRCFSPAVTARKFGNQDNWLPQLQSFPFWMVQNPQFWWSGWTAEWSPPCCYWKHSQVHRSKLLNSSYEVVLNTLTGQTSSSRRKLKISLHCSLCPHCPSPRNTLYKQYATIHPPLRYWIFQKLFFVYTLKFIYGILFLSMGLSSILWLFWSMLSCTVQL